jgi:hypothetical protein
MPVNPDQRGSAAVKTPPQAPCRTHWPGDVTIAAFSARLRRQLDLDTLSAELLAVINQTMEPTNAALWLRPFPNRLVKP